MRTSSRYRAWWRHCRFLRKGTRITGSHCNILNGSSSEIFYVSGRERAAVDESEVPPSLGSREGIFSEVLADLTGPIGEK